jgi:hypothetical protein
MIDRISSESLDLARLGSQLQGFFGCGTHTLSMAYFARLTTEGFGGFLIFFAMAVALPALGGG